MFTYAGFGFGFWWIFPIIMIVFCFFMMRRMHGMGGCMMGRHDMQNKDSLHEKDNACLKKKEGG
jgi:hypothetical protein